MITRQGRKRKPTSSNSKESEIFHGVTNNYHPQSHYFSYTEGYPYYDASFPHSYHRNSEKNEEGNIDKKYIWKPQLAFLNALGPTAVELNLHDEFTSVTLNKENMEYLNEDISLSREGKKIFFHRIIQ